MATGVLNIDMGLALGKHSINYTIEHTGKGYVSFIADMPFVAKIRKNEPTFEQLEIRPEKSTTNKITQVKEFLDNYKKLLELKQNIPLVIAEKPTFEINKLKDVKNDLKLSIFSKFFNARAAVEIPEVQKMLNDLENALDVEKARSGDLW